MEHSSRRDFLKMAATGGAIAGTAVMTAGLSPRKVEGQAKNSPKIYYRDLGTTGYKASEIGFGAMNTRDAELIHAAIDAGINYLDTAHRYMNGANEEVVGSVMKTKRDKVFLSTKMPKQTYQEILRLMEVSLKRLQIDHVDSASFTTIRRREILKEDHLRHSEEMK